jgi:Tfp pilus assembly protein PilF
MIGIRPQGSRASMPQVRVFLMFVAMLFVGSAKAQPGGYSTTDKKAIKQYESGVECMRQQRAACARSEFTKAAEADERFVEPRIMLAEIAEQEGNDAEAIR